MIVEVEKPTTQLISSESKTPQREDIPLDPKIIQIMQPLRPHHLEFMASLKGAIEKVFVDYFYSARKKGLFVSMKDLIDLHDSISVTANKDVEYDEKNRRVKAVLRRLKEKIYPQGLIIHSELFKDPKENKYKNCLVLLTKEEKEALDSSTHTNGDRPLEDQEEKQFLDVKAISKITGISNTVRLAQIIRSLVKKDPNLPIFHLAPKMPTKMYFRTHDVNKKIVPEVKALQEKRKIPDSTAQEPADQEGEDPFDNNPFHKEYRARGLLGKTLEEVHGELEINISNLLLSHLAHGTLNAVIKNPEQLLKNFLPRPRYAQISLSSVIKDIPPKEFILTSLRNCLQRAWSRNGPAWSDPEKDKKSINYCLQIKRQGLTPDTALEKVDAHFSTRTAVTSSAATEFPKDLGRF